MDYPPSALSARNVSSVARFAYQFSSVGNDLTPDNGGDQKSPEILPRVYIPVAQRGRHGVAEFDSFVHVNDDQVCTRAHGDSSLAVKTKNPCQVVAAYLDNFLERDSSIVHALAENGRQYQLAAVKV